MANMTIDSRISVGSAVAVDGVDLVVSAGGRALRVTLDGGRFVFSGSATGTHSIDAYVSSADRLLAHWRGYCENAGAVTESAS